MYLYLNTVLTKVFAIVFVFGKFIVFVFVFKYYAMYLDPSLFRIKYSTILCVCLITLFAVNIPDIDNIEIESSDDAEGSTISKRRVYNYRVI